MSENEKTEISFLSLALGAGLLILVITFAMAAKANGLY